MDAPPALFNGGTEVHHLPSLGGELPAASSCISLTCASRLVQPTHVQQDGVDHALQNFDGNTLVTLADADVSGPDPRARAREALHAGAGIRGRRHGSDAGLARDRRTADGPEDPPPPPPDLLQAGEKTNQKPEATRRNSGVFNRQGVGG